MSATDKTTNAEISFTSWDEDYVPTVDVTYFRKERIAEIRTGLDPIAAALAPAMDKLTEGKKIWAFWSGDGALSAASDGANAEVALEASALGQVFNGLSIVPAVANMPLWSALSRAYATFAGQKFGERTFRGFLSQKPREQSIIKKVEQPRFKMLAEAAKAAPQVSYHAVAQDVTNTKVYDPTVTDGSLRGVFRSGSDMDAEGSFAATENAKRFAARELAPTAATAPGSPAPVIAGVDPPKSDHAQVPGSAVPGVGKGNVPLVSEGAQAHAGNAPAAPVGVADVQAKNPDQKVPVVGELVQKPGSPGASVGQGNGVGESQQGTQVGQVAHGATPPQAAPEVKPAVPPTVAPPKPAGPAAPVAAADAKAPVPPAVVPPVAEPPKEEAHKGKVADVPRLGFQDEKGDQHHIYVDGTPPRVIKASTPTDITNAFPLADQIAADTKTYLSMDAESKEAKALLATIKSNMAKLLETMKENRAPTDLSKERQAFEKRLGTHASTHGAALDASAEMCNTIWNMIQGLADATKSKERDYDTILADLAAECGKPLDSGYAGAIGQEFEVIKGVLTGSGSLRERCLIGYNFQDAMGKFAFKATEDELTAAMTRAGLKEKEIADMKAKVAAGNAKKQTGAKPLFGDKKDNAEFAQAKENDAVTGREMDQRLPAIPLGALPENVLRALAKSKGVPDSEKASVDQLVAALTAIQGKKTTGAGLGNPLAQSERPRDDKDVALTEQEGKAVSFRGEDYLPFLEGEVANLLDEKNAWIKKARDLQMPLKAGISGTTHRYMNFAKSIGIGGLDRMRLAMIGYLIPMNAHSFHKIMTASRGHSGCDYVAGHYEPLSPVGSGELEGLAGGQAKWDAIKAPQKGEVGA